MLYNKYEFMPYIPYKIVEYLATNNENLWKILKYNDYDCLSKPNLTFEEKIALIWNTEGNQENYSIFFSQLVENMIPDSKSILKIYKVLTTPRNTIQAVGSYEFDILYGGKIALVEYNGIPCNRGDVVEAEILRTLNGADVGGVGMLQFNTKLSTASRSSLNLGNSKTFTGTSLVLSVELSDLGEGDAAC